MGEVILRLVIILFIAGCTALYNAYEDRDEGTDKSQTAHEITLEDR